MERISTLEEEIAELKNTLLAKEKELCRLRKKWAASQRKQIDPTYKLPFQLDFNHSTKIGDKLPKWAIERYSRQILLPEIGVEGQEKICASSVLVVGVGGLGCPAAAYLAAAGVGELTLVDYDKVSLTNLHRQILHGEGDQDINKAVSAVASLRKINSKIRIEPYNRPLDTLNVVDLVSRHDAVLDCTDNVATRYLLADACAMAKSVLISGSALKMEGQLTVYSYRADKNKNEKDPNYVGPCYRCVFPTPPPLEAVGSCAANGVAGPVPGMIGCLQALEAIKVVVGYTHDKLLVGRMLIFDGEDMTFRTVKLRPRNPLCGACVVVPAGGRVLDYQLFCNDQKREEEFELELLPSDYRITVQEFAILLNRHEREKTINSELREPNACPLLVDVRSAAEFNMCCIDGAVNYPVEELYDDKLESLLDLIRDHNNQVTFICRRGNDSQIATKRVLDALESGQRHKIKDLCGGLHAWAKHVDHYFPIY